MAGPVVAVGDILQLNVEGVLYGQRTVNTFYFAVTVNDDMSTLGQFLDTFLDPNVDQMMPDIMSVDWKFFRGVGSIIHPVLRRSAQVVSDVAVRDGQVAGDSLPPSVTYVIARRTNIRGPRGRGRVFIPGVPETYHDSGQLTGAAVTAITAKLDDFALPIVRADGLAVPVLWHRAPAGADVIETWTLDRILRSQRRREIAVGI